MEFRNVPKKRTSNFREDETKLLIKLWGSSTIQNKLYLTHRKAPVMRLISLNMAKRGFHRTPDEIKTRIRNLKCLYHRIKKSVATGSGIGTVDPDWPHYKAMDSILSRKHALRQQLVYNQNLLSEVNSSSNNEIAIKQELEDELEFDNVEEHSMEGSFTSNSVGTEDEFEEQHPAIPATVTPLIIEEESLPGGLMRINAKHVTKNGAPVIHTSKSSIKSSSSSSATTSTQSAPARNFSKIQVAQNLFTSTSKYGVNGHSVVNNTTKTPSSTLKNLLNGIPVSSSGHLSQKSNKNQAATTTTNSNHKSAINPSSTVPFPLLILNGLQSGQNGTTTTATMQLPQGVPVTAPQNLNGLNQYSEFSKILKEMLDVQKENLQIHRERLEVEKEKLSFERTIGSQLVSMATVLNSLVYQINGTSSSHTEENEDRAREMEQQSATCIMDSNSGSGESFATSANTARIVPNATSVITQNKLYEEDLDAGQLIVDQDGDLVMDQDDENDSKNFVGHPNYHHNQYEEKSSKASSNDDNPLASLKNNKISKTVIDGIKKYMEKHYINENEKTGKQ